MRVSGQIFTVGATCVLSFLAGIATSLVFVSESLPEVAPTETRDPNMAVIKQLHRNASKLNEIDGRMGRRLDALRREMVEGRDAARPVAAGGAVAAPGGDGAGAGTRPGFALRDRPGTLPPARLEALEPLGDWLSDAAIRSRWLLTSQDAALESFGAPDELVVHDGEEWWSYWVTDGSRIKREYRLRFHQGRLVGAQHVTWKKPRLVPGSER